MNVERLDASGDRAPVRRWLGAGVLALATVALVAGCATGPQAPSAAPTPSTVTSGPSISAAPAPGTSAAAAWEALMGPDGEYAAAAYQAVLDRYGSVEPYASIEQAELRHVVALTRQLERLGVSVPSNPWTGRIPAPSDLQTAAQAWADGEVRNIALYDRLIPQTQGRDPVLAHVFTMLRQVSAQSHLPLFRQAAANGGTIPADQMPATGMMGGGGN